MNVKMIFTVIYLGSMILQIFMMTYHANEIKVQSIAVSDALYESNWYEQNEKVKKCIQMIMMRSQKELSLTIGPFYPVTASTAISILKVSYSYVSLMMNSVDK